MSVPLSATMTSGANGPRRKRLRESCNACALSKVRCSQDKPSCVRCVMQGRTCQYSISLRSGRQSKSASANRGPAQTQPSRQSSIASFDRLSVNGQSQSLPAKPSPSPQPIARNIPSIHGKIEIAVGGNDMSDTMSINQGSPFDLDFDGPFNPSISSSDPSSCADLAGLYLNSQAAFNGLEELAPSLTDDYLMCNIHPTLTCSPIPFPAPSIPYCYEDCMAMTLNTLKSLQIPRIACASTTFIHPATLSQPLDPTLDQVLRFCQNSIDAVTTILQCTCLTSDSDLSILIGLIISKLLAWYSAAARANTLELNSNMRTRSSSSCGSESNTTGFDLNFPPLSNTSSASSSMPAAALERVVIMPITIGAYRLDQENEARVRAQFVLNQLHKVARLIGRFSERLNSTACTDQHTDGASAGSGSISIEQQMDADLRSKLRQVVKEVTRAC